jgi:hypothetical protein
LREEKKLLSGAIVILSGCMIGYLRSSKAFLYLRFRRKMLLVICWIIVLSIAYSIYSPQSRKTSWPLSCGLSIVFCCVLSCYYFSLPLEKFRFSKEFIELRRQALDLFINRIASHPELKQSEDLRTFLQADEEVMDLHK